MAKKFAAVRLNCIRYVFDVFPVRETISIEKNAAAPNQNLVEVSHDESPTEIC
jgi:hypothetical protein